MAPHIHTTHAMRLGFQRSSASKKRTCSNSQTVASKAYNSVRDLWLRSGLSSTVLERLADADAFRSLGLDRRQALWAVRGLDRVGDQDDLPLFASRPGRDTEPDARLPPMPLGAHVVEDYRRLSLSLKAHPASFMRARLSARGILRSEALRSVKNGERVTVAGLVLVRQRPGTAGGVIFMTLEDETGVANIIVWPKVFERLRAIVLGSALCRGDRQAAERARGHPYRRRAHERPDVDAWASVGGGPDDRRSCARRRGASDGTDGDPKAARQSLRSSRRVLTIRAPRPASPPMGQWTSPRRCRRGGIFVDHLGSNRLERFAVEQTSRCSEVF